MPAPTAPPGTAPESLNPQYLEQQIRTILTNLSTRTPRTPLTAASFSDETLIPVAPTVIPADDYYKLSLETAHKSILYDIAINQPEDASGDAATSGLTFHDLLDFALVCAELEMADNGLPFTLLEEMFDTQTIPQCERLFEYLETRVERLTAGMEGGKGKALVLLRLCNELLRRLSKAEDTIFCGRILIFLSKSFPISERSAVNLRGDFNVDNVTIYDEMVEEEQAEKTDDAMQVDEPTPADDGTEPQDKEKSPSKDEEVKQPKKEEPPISLNKLYTIFWRLQHDFADPTRLFQPENFEIFKTGLAATMRKFKEADKEAYRSSGGKHDPAHTKKPGDQKPPVTGEKRKREEMASDELKGEGFNPKYLTSRELFELEISDLTFRRHVLVQAMILLDFLLGLTTSAKEKWAQLKTPNRSVQYAFTLSPEDEKWALQTRAEITQSLQPDQPGRLFMRLINTVLTREQNWVKWKAEGCHQFDLPPLPRAEIDDAKEKAMSHTKAATPFPHVMGTPMLSRLWNQTGKKLKVEDLKDEDRRRVPSLDDFAASVAQDFEELKDAMFPSDVEEGQNKIHAKQWKALRLASKSKFHVFNRLDDKFDDLRDELKMLKETEEKVAEESRLRNFSAISAREAAKKKVEEEEKKGDEKNGDPGTKEEGQKTEDVKMEEDKPEEKTAKPVEKTVKEEGGHEEKHEEKKEEKQEEKNGEAQERAVEDKPAKTNGDTEIKMDVEQA